MANPFLAEIRIFPFNFAPKGWAFCDGQVLPISQNTALFSLLGTTYGGDGRSTFALPDLQGSVPLHPGQGPGLNQYFLGESGGVQTVTLLQSELPLHSHFVNADTGSASSGSPAGGIFKAGIRPGNPSGAVWLYNKGPADTPIQGVGIAGGNQPHNNMMPYLTLNFCIALQGVFPARP